MSSIKNPICIGFFAGSYETPKNWIIYANPDYCTKTSQTEFINRTTTQNILTFTKACNAIIYYTMQTDRPTSGYNNGTAILYKNDTALSTLGTANVTIAEGSMEISFSYGDYMKAMLGGTDYYMQCMILKAD